VKQAPFNSQSIRKCNGITFKFNYQIPVEQQQIPVERGVPDANALDN